MIYLGIYIAIVILILVGLQSVGLDPPKPLKQVMTYYYVDGRQGHDSNDGLRWDQAFATIGAAMIANSFIGARGPAQIFVAPDSNKIKRRRNAVS